MICARVSRMLCSRTVTVVCPRTQEPMADDLLDVLGRIAEKDPPRPGLRVRFGWSILTLREQADGGLIVCEPDFDGDPLREVRPRIDTTLEVLARQTALVRRVGVTPVDLGFEQFVLVARGALSATELGLFRYEPERDDDTGWTISSPEHPGSAEDPDAFEAIRVFALLSLRPVVLSVLGLPPEFAAIIDGDQITAVMGPDGRNLLSLPVRDPW